MQDKKEVLILGGGYATLSFLKNLPSAYFEEAHFKLISKSNEHYTSVLLHESVSMNRNIGYAYKQILPHAVEFVQDEVLRIEEGNVFTRSGSHRYDVLLIGLGFESDDFGIGGIAQYAYPMVSLENCRVIHTKICEKIQAFAHEQKSDQILQFVVCGGGFSGVELVASLAEELPKICLRYGIESNRVRLVCIEAMDQILPMFPSSLMQKALHYLQAQGICVEVGCKILEVRESSVLVEQGGKQRVIESDMTFWSAGVRGSSVLAQSSFFNSVRNKIEVDSHLQPINQQNQYAMDKIFVLGDCAAFKDSQSGRFFPPTAQIAMRQGQYLAGVFDEVLHNKPITQDFSFSSRGTICSLGSHFAIGLVGERHISGKIAIWIKRWTEFVWVAKLKGYVGALFG